MGDDVVVVVKLKYEINPSIGDHYRIHAAL